MMSGQITHPLEKLFKQSFIISFAGDFTTNSVSLPFIAFLIKISRNIKLKTDYIRMLCSQNSGGGRKELKSRSNGSDDEDKFGDDDDDDERNEGRREDTSGWYMSGFDRRHKIVHAYTSWDSAHTMSEDLDLASSEDATDESVTVSKHGSFQTFNLFKLRSFFLSLFNFLLQFPMLRTCTLQFPSPSISYFFLWTQLMNQSQ